tara:strand:- start:20908 stop:22578 length:1671 start_codon:yes stop_codon:yes gene_type:complete
LVGGIKMKIAGIWSGHDSSFCILENGIPTIHAEYERYNREKSPQTDSIKFMFDRLNDDDIEDIVNFATVYPTSKTSQHQVSFNTAKELAEKNGGKFFFISHHQAHAAHAFYSSKFNDAIVITLDGGGVEDDNGGETATTLWYGSDTQLTGIRKFPTHQINIGGVWTRVTRYIFKLQNGWPLGGQEGSVMAMAAPGDPTKYHDDFYKMLTTDVLSAGFKPPNQPKGAYVKGKDPVHPYLNKWSEIADRSEQDKFDLAAGLQSATERLVKEFIEFALNASPHCKNICLAGGVSLNSVIAGKIKSWFPDRIDGVYIPAVPYDGGLSLGAAQWVWHHHLGNPRVQWNDNLSPYLGEEWKKEDVDAALQNLPTDIEINKSNDEDVINLLKSGGIVSIFNEGSESGRRALGNRSILADPRRKEMKDRVNAKVKHRQWYRPFAPSILYEEAQNWFKNPIESAYMQFVLMFKDEMKDKVPAVVHFDGSARLQTVTENDNAWYYGFLKKWHTHSGVPIILNTSFNDREPICETPQHAINCFLNTDIDALYFPQYEILLKKVLDNE